MVSCGGIFLEGVVGAQGRLFRQAATQATRSTTATAYHFNQNNRLLYKKRLVLGPCVITMYVLVPNHAAVAARILCLLGLELIFRIFPMK